MSRSWIKGLVCIVTFTISLFVISSIMNRGNTDMTMAMSEASYPLVYINHEGQYINCLHGYNNEMDVSFMRDTITPLADDRRISLYIDKYNNVYAITDYDVDGSDRYINKNSDKYMLFLKQVSTAIIEQRIRL